MNSADNKPNQGEGRKPQNGVPDLSDLMNRGNQAPEKTEAVDLSSLMNEIRRVPSSGTPKSLSQAPEGIFRHVSQIQYKDRQQPVLYRTLPFIHLMLPEEGSGIRSSRQRDEWFLLF